MGGLFVALSIITLVFLTSNVGGQTNEGMVVSLFSNDSGRLIFYEGNPTKQGSTMTNRTYSFKYATSRIYSIAADYHRKEIFVMLNFPGEIIRLSNVNIWLNNTDLKATTFHAGVSNEVSQIAVDWVHGNVYWADRTHHMIVVKSSRSRDPSMQKVLMHDAQSPMAIAVDPVNGYMFWSDFGNNPSISRATLAGEHITVLAYLGIDYPSGITLDYQNKVIYWVDIIRDSLEYMDYNGGNRELIRRVNGALFIALALNKNTLCVTDYKAKRVIAFDKLTKNAINIWDNLPGNPTGITMFNGDTQPMIEDVCAQKSCSHLCVKTPDGPQCLCKNGYSLMENGISCNESKTSWKEEVVFAIPGSGICIFDAHFLSLSDDITYTCPIPNTAVVRGLAADMQDGQIFYFINSTIYMHLLASNTSMELVRSYGLIIDIVYDWMDADLYWTEKDSGRIMTISVKTKAQLAVHTGIVSPGAITADPHDSTLFWLSGSSKYLIMASKMDGSELRVLVSGTDLRRPSDLTFDLKSDRLYWLDNSVIKSGKIDGTDIKTELSTAEGGKFISVYKNYLLWTEDSVSTSKLRAGVISRNLYRKTKLFSSLVTALMVYDSTSQQNEKGPCWVNNGGCDHVCIPEDQSVDCRCALGYTLKTDGFSCSSDLMVNNYLLVSDSTNRDIYQVSLSTGNLVSVDIENMGSSVIGMTYDVDEQKLYWSDFNTGIVSSTLGSRTGRVIYRLWLHHARRVAFDETSKNLYYTGYPSSTSTGYIAVYNERKNIHQKIITEVQSPVAILLVPSQSIMFWTDYGTGAIYRSMMDGSDSSTILSNLRWPSGLALDYTDNRLYYTDGYTDVIGYIDLSNMEHGMIFTDGNAHLQDIVLSGDYLYYTAWSRNYITKMKKDNPSLRTKLAQHGEFGRLEALYVDDGVRQIRNTVCAHRNGGCSGLCLPTNTGRKCVCGDGVDLNEDEKSCKGDKLCSDIIENGVLSSSCFRYEKEVCTFSCNSDYELQTDTNAVRCELEGTWNVSEGHFCKRETKSSTGALVAQGPVTHGLSSELIIGIGCGVTGFVIILVVTILIVLKIHIRKRKQTNNGIENPLFQIVEYDTMAATCQVAAPSRTIESQLPSNDYATLHGEHLDSLQEMQSKALPQ